MNSVRVQLEDPIPAVWAARAEEHRAYLKGALPGTPIEHIGSTAIGGIRSKDVVDLLVGVPQDTCPDATERLKSCVIAGMLAGADSIDDLDLLRHGAMGRIFGGVRAPSTLGTY